MVSDLSERFLVHEFLPQEAVGNIPGKFRPGYEACELAVRCLVVHRHDGLDDIARRRKSKFVIKNVRKASKAFTLDHALLAVVWKCAQ